MGRSPRVAQAQFTLSPVVLAAENDDFRLNVRYIGVCAHLIDRDFMGPDVEIYKPVQILSASTGVELVSKVKKSVTDGKKHFLVDLSEALFMDSTGLGYLVVALQQAKAAKQGFYLCSLRGQAAMLLELTNTDKKFHIFPDQAQFNQWLQQQDA